MERTFGQSSFLAEIDPVDRTRTFAGNAKVLCLRSFIEENKIESYTISNKGQYNTQ